MSTEIKYIGSGLEAEKHRFYSKKKKRNPLTTLNLSYFHVLSCLSNTSKRVFLEFSLQNWQLHSEKDFTVVGPAVVGQEIAPVGNIIAPKTTTISTHRIHKIHI